MSKRISKERARRLCEKDLELQHLQREGKPLPTSNRRQKKYLMQVKKQKGFIKYLIARNKLHGHNKKAKELEEQIN